MNFRRAGLSLAGCFVISTAMATSYVTADSYAPAAIAAIRTARSQFRPLTKDDLHQAKDNLLAAANRLDSKFKEDANNGEGWRKYTELDKLLQQLHQPSEPEAAFLDAIYQKLAAGHEGLELVWFVDVRQALKKYLETASGIDNAQVKTIFENVLDKLANDIEAYTAAPSPDQAFQIGEALGWLDNAGQAPQVVQAVRNRFMRPNVYIQVSGNVVATGIAGPVDEISPVCDNILGTDIQGTARTIGCTTVSLYPDPDVAVFDTVLLATTRTQNIGRNGPVYIYNTGLTGVGACKRLWMDAEGLWAHPAVSNAQTHTRINDIKANNGRAIVERVAWKRADQQQAEAEMIASQHAQWQVNQRVDQRALATLQQANDSYQKKFRRPLSERKIFPQVLHFSTTAADVQVVGLEAAADQLAAPDDPPALAQKDADMAVCIHESSINNTAASVLSGMRLHEATLQTTISDMLGYVPERLKPDQGQEPWTIVFARQQPVSVRFADNGFSITLRGQEYFKGDKGYPGMNVTAAYKFTSTGGVLKAVRQGELQIFPPNFVPGGGKQLSVRQQVIRTLLERRLGKVFEPEMVAKGFAPKGRWAGIGTMRAVEMAAERGWLVVGWQRTAAEKVVAAR